jgi:hypothetical protein
MTKMAKHFDEKRRVFDFLTKLEENDFLELGA